MRACVCEGGRRRLGSRRGSAAIEVGIMLPWIIFSFICVLDFGFSAYALIATQDAARIAATFGAANSTNASNIANTACGYAAPQFKYAPTPVTACGTALSVATSTSSSPMATVTVAVTYTVSLISIPGLMPSSLPITKSVTMPVR